MLIDIDQCMIHHSETHSCRKCGTGLYSLEQPLAPHLNIVDSKTSDKTVPDLGDHVVISEESRKCIK